MAGINGLYLLLFVVSLGLAAFFCSAETAFIGMQKLRLQHLIHINQPQARIVARILAQPEKFLATVLLGINLFETTSATLGTLMAVSLWGESWGAALAIIMVTLLTLVLAELIPKSLATRYGEKIALSYARPIEFVAIVLYPLVYVLHHIGLRFTNLLSEGSELKPTISHEELRTAIRVGEAEGTMAEAEAEMLHNVFEFGDRPVREIMLPRPEVVFIEYGSTIADFLALYAQFPLSRFPVYKESRDNVVGILAIKDVLMAQAKGSIDNESVIDELVRPAYFTPEGKLIDELFVEMQSKNYHLCIVVDEFGGTAGIVTLNQLIEQIVGPVGEELSARQKDYEIINEHTFQIEGSMRIEEVNEEMGLELPEGDYETVAGFVLSLLGQIPKPNEQLRYKDLKLVVIEMRGAKIEKILLTRESHAASAGSA